MRNKISIAYLIVQLLLLSSCKDEAYTFHGKLTGVKGVGRAMLLDPVNFNGDTVAMVDGEFIFEGQLEQPKMFRLMLATPENPPYEILKSSLVYIENSEIDFNGDFNAIETYCMYTDTTEQRPQLMGSEANKLYEEYLKLTRNYVNAASRINSQFLSDTVTLDQKTEADLAKAIDLQEKLEKLQQKRDDIKSTFILDHPSSELAYDLVYASVALDKRYEERIDESIARGAGYYMALSLPDSIISRRWIKALEESGSFSKVRMDSLYTLASACNRLGSGASFMDGEVTTLDGKKVDLSTLIKDDQYTIIDFWASWCGPCRESLPHVKQLYAKYEEAGLNIISISVDDYKLAKSSWLKAVEEEQMPWAQYQAEWEGEVPTNYNVMSIPNIVVIAPHHKILKTGVRGLALDLLLKNVYGY